MLLRVYILGIVALYSTSLSAQMTRDTFTCEIYNRDHSYTFSQINDVLLDSEGYVWLAMTDYGISKINGDFSKKYIETNTGTNFTSGLGLYEDSDSNLFMCTDVGLMLYDRQKDIIEPLAVSSFDKNEAYKNSINCISKIGNNKYLLGSNSGPHIYDMAIDSILRFNITGEHGLDGESTNRHIYKMAEDTVGNCIWMTSRSGLYKFDNNDYSVTKINHSNDKYWPLENMTDIHFYDGHLYIKHLGNKILEYDIEANTWRKYYEEVIDKYYTEDPHDSLMLRLYNTSSFRSKYLIVPNTGTGVNILDLENGTTFKPYVKHELFSEINQYENPELLDHKYLRYTFFGVINRNGYLISSQNKNHLVITNEKVFSTKEDNFGSIQIDDIYINNKQENRATYVDDNHSFTFEKYQRNLSFDYGLVNPHPSANIEYEYKLDNNPWQQNLYKNNLSISQLKGGNHKLILRAKSDGQAIDEVTYKISTEPYWHEKWTYRILMGLFLLIPLLLFNAYRIRKIKEKENLKSAYKKQIAEVEMASLRAQMNPHFLFNSLNSINKYIITSDPKIASEYLTKFSRLMRQILLNSKSKLISLDEELLALKLYIEIEELRFENKFSFDIEVDSNVNASSTQLPPMLLQPYVENAIWHGLMPKKGDGLLRIIIKSQDGQLNIEIDDNGIGRTQAIINNRNKKIKKKSMGMEITRDRLELIKSIYNMDAKIEIIDKYQGEIPLGTKVLISIPILS